jgi:hypothetical protein
MRPNKLSTRLPLIVFATVLALGLILITIAYSSSQLNRIPETGQEQPTEREKQLASAESEMSKWLLGLASAAIAGLVGIRLKNADDDQTADVVPMTAYAFLLLSLYGGFLSYESTVDILRRGPLHYFYGDQFRLPVLVQFWSLAAALVLLAIWLFRKRKKALVLGMLLAMSWVGNAQAEEVKRQKCIQDWYQDRFHTSADSRDIALSVLLRIEKQPNAKPIRSCVDVSSVLDRLRYASLTSGKADSNSEFEKYLVTLNDELGHPELSMSDVVHSIIEMMSPWDKPAGILSVRSSKGTYQILLDTIEVGVTNWTGRLAPGKHRIRIVKDLKVVFSANDYQIAADEYKVLDLDSVIP